MNEKGLHRLLSANSRWILPAIGTPVPIPVVSMSMRSMCSWIVRPLKFLHQRDMGMFVPTLGRFQNTYRKPWFFHFFFGALNRTHVLYLPMFSNGVLLYKSKDLVESDGDVTVCGNPHKWFRILLRSSGEIDEVSQSKNQSINQLKSEVKWNILESVFFNENT